MLVLKKTQSFSNPLIYNDNIFSRTVAYFVNPHVHFVYVQHVPMGRWADELTAPQTTTDRPGVPLVLSIKALRTSSFCAAALWSTSQGDWLAIHHVHRVAHVGDWSATWSRWVFGYRVGERLAIIECLDVGTRTDASDQNKSFPRKILTVTITVTTRSCRHPAAPSVRRRGDCEREEMYYSVPPVNAATTIGLWTSSHKVISGLDRCLSPLPPDARPIGYGPFIRV